VIIAVALVAVAAIVAAIVYRKKSKESSGPPPQSSISFRQGAVGLNRISMPCYCAVGHHLFEWRAA
jgi:hypothetical protein